MKKVFIVPLVVILLVSAILLLARKEKEQEDQAAQITEPSLVATSADPDNSENTETVKSPQPSPKSLSKPEQITIDVSKTYTALLTTSVGEITIVLHADKTPITVNNFVYLANNDFYDGTIFHRIIKGFMIQGGDPTGTGTGSPGYRFDDEPFEGQYTRGIVAMANSGPNTNGSQFFIMHGDTSLPTNYIIFGEVTSGLDTVDKIATAKVATSLGGEQSKPSSPVTIKSVVITVN